MRYRAWKWWLFGALVMAMTMVGCSDDVDSNGHNDNGASDQEEVSDNGEVPVDISRFGITGTDLIGTATLTERDLVFEDSFIELSPNIMSFGSGAIELDVFDAPELYYDEGQTAWMRIHFTGQVQEHSPGEMVLAVESISPRMLDSSQQALGTSTAERLVDELADNGTSFPQPEHDDPLMVTFQITASDEDYSEIYLSADADFFGFFEGVEQ